LNNKKQILSRHPAVIGKFKPDGLIYDLLYRICLCISGNSELGKLKIGMFQPDRELPPALKIDVGFWAVLLPIVTPLVETINCFAALFAKKMRWGRVAYTRRKVIGDTDNSFWRAEARPDNILL
jgi:hypothetical protein